MDLTMHLYRKCQFLRTVSTGTYIDSKDIKITLHTPWKNWHIKVNDLEEKEMSLADIELAITALKNYEPSNALEVQNKNSLLGALNDNYNQLQSVLNLNKL